MKKLSYLLILLLFSCNGNKEVYEKEIKSLNGQIDSLIGVCKENKQRISILKDSLTLLSYPANQRLADINDCVKNEEFKLAKKKIAELKKLFPKSAEAKTCLSVESDIEKKEAIKKAEQDRLKALGFKALKAKTVFTIDYNTITLSSIGIGTTFTYDAYGSGYHYHKADRGEKYVMAAMSVKSTKNYPKIPELQIYTISGDKMERETVFFTDFARWESYGTYLGNYHDNSNDFSKVSTVRFKIHACIKDEIVKRPFAIVCKKENALSRKEDRFRNPPVSYEGYADYKYELKIEDFEKDYILVKLFNL